jgi:hypothetical protein
VASVVVACCPMCKAEASPGFEIDVGMIARFREGVHLFCEPCQQYRQMLPRLEAREAEAA